MFFVQLSSRQWQRRSNYTEGAVFELLQEYLKGLCGGGQTTIFICGLRGGGGGVVVVRA